MITITILEKQKKTNKTLGKVHLTFIYQCLKVLYKSSSHVLTLSMVKMSCRYYLHISFEVTTFKCVFTRRTAGGAHGTTLAPSAYCITKTLPPIRFKTLLHIFHKLRHHFVITLLMMMGTHGRMVTIVPISAHSASLRLKKATLPVQKSYCLKPSCVHDNTVTLAIPLDPVQLT